MLIKDFGVEIWMNEHENHCSYNIAETCVASLTVEELLTMSGHRNDLMDTLLPIKLTYGPIAGSLQLRNNVAGLFDKAGAEDVLITHGAIGANALIYQSLIGRGDHVVSVLPTYQQHYSIPESIGATVDIAWLRAENDFNLDMEELRGLVTLETKLISLTNPNNPTGALIDAAGLQAIADIAREVGAYVLCDEVYRGVVIDSDEMSTSIVDLYERGISTGSMSKAFSLAGLRLGWVVAPPEVISAVSIHRDYNTISVGQIDDLLATFALDCKDAILSRSRSIVRTNAKILADWVQSEPRMTYVPPKAGTVTLLKYDHDDCSLDVAKSILAGSGALFTPGSALSMEGYLRIGFANNADVLTNGLEAVSSYIKRAW